MFGRAEREQAEREARERRAREIADSNAQRRREFEEAEMSRKAKRDQDDAARLDKILSMTVAEHMDQAATIQAQGASSDTLVRMHAAVQTHLMWAMVKQHQGRP